MNGRLLSLDAYRGGIIIAMVLVNCPGGDINYKMLTHAEWNGWTFTDLIAPGFLWVIGISMVFALQRRMKEVSNRREIFKHILFRSFLIFIIGIVLQLIDTYDHPDMYSTFKYMDILQRIAISYLIAATLYVTTGIRGHAVWAFAGPLIYWILLLSIPVPGIGAGRLDPVGNAASYIDFLLLGQHGGNPHSLLSLLTSTATISFGVLTGYLLKLDFSNRKKTVWILLVGVGLVLLGEIAGQWIPLNRRLWTPSFVFLTAGISTITFCAFFWLIEVTHYRKWTTPFVVFGLNPILIFSFSELGRILANKKGVTLEDGRWHSLWDCVYRMLFLKIADPVNASLLFSLTYVFIFLIFGYVMYRKGWIVKI